MDQSIVRSEHPSIQKFVGLQKRLAPLSQEVKTVSDRLMSSQKLGDLESGVQILETMSGRLNELASAKPTMMDRLTFGKWAKIKFVLKRRILHRKEVRTVLQEMWREFGQTRETLSKNISNLQSLETAAGKTAEALQNLEGDLQAELLPINSRLVELATSNTVTDDTTLLVRAKQLGEKLLADTKGFHFLQEGIIQQIGTQLHERRMLDTSMQSVGPQIEIQLNQQLAFLISQMEVRAAIQVVNRVIDGVNAMAVATAEMAKQDAIATAEIVSMPVIKNETIESVAASTREMISGVAEAFTRGLNECRRVAETTDGQRQQIHQAVEQFQKTMLNAVQEERRELS